MIDKNSYIIRISHCVYVDGYLRGLFCDLQRNFFTIVPKDLGYIVNEFNNRKISEVYEHFGSQNREILDQYFTFLLKEELVFFSPNREMDGRFSALGRKPDDFGIIDYAIIDIDKSSMFEIGNVIEKLTKVGCKYFQIRFFRDVSLLEICNLASEIENEEIINVDIILPYKPIFTDFDYDTFFVKYQTFSDFVIYNAPEVVKREYYNGAFTVNFIDSTIDSSSHCGIVSLKYFSTNQKFFDRAVNYNSCLYRKVGVDCKGNVKNCPSMTKSFGNIIDDDLSAILLSIDFQRAGKIRKDNISICKACEFRYVCTDCRAYLEAPEDLLSKPLKCGYDPYTAKWNKWAENPLNKAAIEYYQLVNLSFK